MATGDLSIGNESLSLNGVGVSSLGALRNNSGNNTWGGTISLTGASTIYADAGLLTLSPSNGNAISSANFGLTLNASSNSVGGVISGTVVLGSGGISQSNGFYTLMVGNSYSGATSVSGIMNIRNGGSLGSGVVTVVNGHSLQLQGGISVANAITLSGQGVSSLGGIRSISGVNTLSGVITLGVYPELIRMRMS